MSVSKAPVVVDDDYREGWNDIFGKRDMTQGREETEDHKVFYVDVGDAPPDRAAEILKKLMEKNSK